MIITIPIVGLLSAWYINKNSKSIERLGISTNSKVLKFYLAFWVSLSVFCIFDIVIVLEIDYEKLMGTDHNFDYPAMIIDASFRGIGGSIISCLDLLVLLAYYKNSKKLSARVSKLVTKNLRSESVSTISVDHQ